MVAFSDEARSTLVRPLKSLRSKFVPTMLPLRGLSERRLLPSSRCRAHRRPPSTWIRCARTSR